MRTWNRAPTRFKPSDRASLTRGLRHVRGVIRTAMDLSHCPAQERGPRCYIARGSPSPLPRFRTRSGRPTCRATTSARYCAADNPAAAARARTASHTGRCVRVCSNGGTDEADANGSGLRSKPPCLSRSRTRSGRSTCRASTSARYCESGNPAAVARACTASRTANGDCVDCNSRRSPLCGCPMPITLPRQDVNLIEDTPGVSYHARSRMTPE